MNIVDRYLKLRSYEKNRNYREKKIKDLLKEPENQNIIKLLERAIESYKEKSYKETERLLIKINEDSGFQSKEILGLFYTLGETLGDFTQTINALFKFAYNAYKRGEYESCLEAYNLGFSYLFSKSYQSGLLYKDYLKEGEEVYRFLSDFCKKKLFFSGKEAKKKKKLNLVHIVGNLIDDTHSPTKILKSFLKYHNYDIFNLFVFSSEILVKRKRANLPIKQILPNSYHRAPKFINFMKERKIDYFFSSVDVPQIESITLLAREVISKDIDIAIFHSSMAFTIDCILAGMKLIPLQTNLSHGGIISSGGIEAIFYFVESSFRREKEYLRDRNIKSYLVDISYDIDEDLEKINLDKRESFIPKEKVILITVSNHLEKRLTEEFLDILIKILKENRDTIYLAVGGGNLERQKDILGKAKLLDRVIFTGPREDALRLMKYSDIYLNEFPAGSGCAVLEAMACGKPIVAMHYSDEHTHSIGANYVGENLSIRSKDYLSYINFTNRLIKDERYRREVGDMMRRRYELKFSPLKIVKDCEEVIIDLYQEKIKDKIE